MAVTYFGKGSDPADNGANALNDTAIVVPPGSMVAGDLAVVLVTARSGSATTLSNSNTAGQTWNSENNFQNGSGLAERVFWCRFNGTWTADPVFASSFSSSTIPLNAQMVVFRPTTGGNTWEVDVQEATAAYAGPGSPFDITVTGISTQTDGAVVLVGFSCQAANTWAIQTGGWTNPGGETQVRNTSGSDLSTAIVYQIKASAGATGDITNRESAGTIAVSYIIAFKEVISTISGSGTPALGTVALASATTLLLTAAAAPIVGAVASAAAATLPIAAASALTLGEPTASGASTLLVQGASAAVLEPLALAGESVLPIAAESASVLGEPALAAQGALAIAGEAAAVLGGLTLAATGELEAAQGSGSAALVLGEPVLAAAGALTVSASGEAVFGLLAGSGTATLALAGAGDAVLGELHGSGTGTLVVSGAAAIQFGPLVVTASETAPHLTVLPGLKVSATGDRGIPPVSLYGEWSPVELVGEWSPVALVGKRPGVSLTGGVR